MQKVETLFSQVLYEKSLSTINSLHFTKREIDVMACLLSGRRTSKIAYLLSINPRTIETHIRNIMSKLECNTRESIIDFIEATDKTHYFRRYYSLLQGEAIFIKSLNDILKLNREKSSRCFLKFVKDKESLGVYLKSHLTLAGITLLSSPKRKDGDYIIIIGPQAITAEETLSLPRKANENISEVVFLLQDRKNHKNLPEWLTDANVVDFEKYEDYYFSFFILLQKLLPNLNWGGIISQFKDKYKKTPVESASSQTSSNKVPSKNLFTSPLSRSHTFYFMVLFIGIVSFCGFLTLLGYQKEKDHGTLRSDLVIPKESAFLSRPELLAQIHNKLKKQSGIQTVALVGPGGTGKTTLARQYAHEQKANIIWEINAETNETLMTSFENLAQTLFKTEKDQNALKKIQSITGSLEKEERIIQFVKAQLKSKPNWCLIYDNVASFKDIYKYFPHDSDSWGKGQVILTTRDSNVGSNKYINNTIPIGDLSTEQKIALYTKIIKNGYDDSFTAAQTEETRLFLEQIPPFPLDVSIAAYYIKTTSIPRARYLEKLSRNDETFIKLQENLLKEAGDYTKTRYNIIILSIQNLIASHLEFRDLILFISMLNSQNIPRDLLAKFKDESIVDNFIYHLKKYSFLTERYSTPSFSNSDFSIHRSTQTLSLAYLKSSLNLEKNKELIESLAESLLTYTDEAIKKMDLVKMKALERHYETFLSHKSLFTPSMEGALKGELGIIKYFYGDNIKAKMLLEEGILKLEKHHETNSTRFALLIGFLGNVLRDLGDYHDGKKHIEKSLSIYRKNYFADNFWHAHFLVYLGIIERILGRYETAKNLFIEGINIQKKHFPENENSAAWAQGQLGIIERELGNYEEAQKLLESSLHTFKTKHPTDFDIAWALEHLSVIYTKLGHYEKARNALEESLKIYASYLPDQAGHPWVLACLEAHNAEKPVKIEDLFSKVISLYQKHFHESYIYVNYPLKQLGNVYKKLGRHEEAEIILKQSLLIYQTNYGASHLTTAQALYELGDFYLLRDNAKLAENYLNKALHIEQQHSHPRRYISLESKAELCVRKYYKAKDKGNVEQSYKFKMQAKNYLKQAFEIVQTYFPKDSPHIARIQSKLKNLEGK